jgi:uncharacterized repeat protein (TIGR03803 family)
MEHLKSCTKNLFIVTALLASFVLVLAGRAAAQTFSNLHSFGPLIPSGITGAYNSDGMNPMAGLVLFGKTLYGVTPFGTPSGSGAVFAVNTDGTGFTNLHIFGANSFYGMNPHNTNSDGLEANATLILSGNTLYGTASQGTSSGAGTVFAIHTDGTGFTNLHNFTALSSLYNGTNSDGAGPNGGVLLSGNTLYGTASSGGSLGKGTIFALNADGTGFTNLHNFTGTNDGANPSAALILSGNTLYGTASGGGSSSNGSIFAINTDGTGFTNLHNFAGGNNGRTPECTLLLLGNIFYGTAEAGLQGVGIVFAVNSDGTGFTNLYNNMGPIGETDGAIRPFAGLVLSGGTFFGTATAGGAGGQFSDGYVYSLRTNGTGFTMTHRFPYNWYQDNGSISGLILSNYTLYGTTQFSGNLGFDTNGTSLGEGSVYSITFLPQLKIVSSGTNVTLSWPTNVSVMDTSGFVLQSATNPFSSASWSAVSPSPVVLNGQYTVTNPIAGAQMFYRLSQ